MTPSADLLGLVSGALAMGYAVAAAFFMKFWRASHDRLFLMFAGAFALLAVQRVAVSLLRNWSESTTWVYLLRLAAFVLIIVAIVEKNRAHPKSPQA